MFKRNFIYEQTEIQKQLETLMKKKAILPPGKLVCRKNGIHYKYFHQTAKETTYIPKKSRAFANQLAQKAYIQASIDDLQVELSAINIYLDKIKNSNQVESLLSNPRFSKFFSSTANPHNEWSTLPYPKNQNHSENLIHASISGNKLRSKSEVIIDMSLFNHKIPYRYECQLDLDKFTIYPDFTLKHPTNNNIYYWEHFGMMDNPTYVREYLWKMELYLSHNIIPGINLITTYETKEHPLSASDVERIIQQFFY